MNKEIGDEINSIKERLQHIYNQIGLKNNELSTILQLVEELKTGMNTLINLPTFKDYNNIYKKVDSLIDFENAYSKAEDDTDLSQMKEFIIEAEPEIQKAAIAIESALSEKSIVDKYTMNYYSIEDRINKLQTQLTIAESQVIQLHSEIANLVTEYTITINQVNSLLLRNVKETIVQYFVFFQTITNNTLHFHWFQHSIINRSHFNFTTRCL